MKKSAALLAVLGALAAPPSPLRADQAPNPVAAAAQQSAIRMQQFIVSAARVAKVPWRYASVPGFEVLSRAPADKTAVMLDSLQRGLWLQNDVMPKDWLPQSPVPYTIIIDDTDLTTVPLGQPHSQTIALESPADAASWGSLSAGAMTWSDQVPAYDGDTLAFNTNVFGVDMDAVAYGSVSLERLGRAAPPLPRWLVAGLIGHTSGMFREGFVPVITRGIFGSGWIHKAHGPGTVWKSVEETRQLVAALNSEKPNEAQTPIVMIPLAEFFAEAPPRPETLSLWESEAGLFVRWGLAGPGSQDPVTASAFLEFARRARLEPVTERVFTGCFGFGYAAMQAKLDSFLRVVIEQPTTIDLDMPASFPKPVLSVATPDQVGRILGDWLRLEGLALKDSDSEMSKESFYFAGRMLARAYRDDNGLPRPDPSHDSPKPEDPLDAEPGRIHDPKLLAVYGLFAHDTGRDAKALLFLEAASNAHVVRPQASALLARLRLADALKRPLGTEGRLSSSQAEAILGPLRAALRRAPTAELCSVAVGTWSHAEARPAAADIDAITANVALFPRDTEMAYNAAHLCAQAGFPAQAEKLIDEGLVFTTHEVNRMYFEQLRSTLAVALSASK